MVGSTFVIMGVGQEPTIRVVPGVQVQVLQVQWVVRVNVVMLLMQIFERDVVSRSVRMQDVPGV